MVRVLMAFLLFLVAPATSRADTYGLPLPRGSRQASGDTYISGRGFRESSEFYGRELVRRGDLFRKVGPYRRRGLDVVRFVLDDGTTAYLAIHVYRADGKSMISFVPRPSR
jgi:hypothetical protein